MEFIVTFGVKYSSEAHPVISTINPKGVMLLTGVKDETEAREILATWLQRKYCSIYERAAWAEDPRHQQYYPLGINIVANVVKGALGHRYVDVHQTSVVRHNIPILGDDD